MKIYLAGERSFSALDRTGKLLWENARTRRRLYSYYYHGYSKGGFRKRTNADGLDDDILLSCELKHDLFLDSGAFTGFTKGVDIDIKEYATFIRKNNIWTIVSSLDAIGRGEEAAQKTFDNYQILLDLDALVQPVFHVREPDHWLDKYVREESLKENGYLLIGGMVPETTQWLMQRLDSLWEKSLTNPDGTAKLRVHGFGLTDSKLMHRYPWYSVDSSSWLMTGVFGSCMFRIKRTGQEKLIKVVFSAESPQARKYKGWHYYNLPPESKLIVDSLLETLAIPNAVDGGYINAENLSRHYLFRDTVNAAVFQGLEDLGTDRFVRPQPVLFS